MAYAIVTKGIAVEHPQGKPLVIDGLQYVLDIFAIAEKNTTGQDTWSIEKLAALGVYPIVDDAVPDGKVKTASTLEFADGGVQRHWTLIDKPTPGPGAVPDEISDRQFAHGLWKMKIISFDDALAFCSTAVIPAALQALIDAVPDEIARQDATLMIAGSTIFYRHHPFTAMLAAGYGWTEAQTDDFWRFAATL